MDSRFPEPRKFPEAELPKPASKPAAPAAAEPVIAKPAPEANTSGSVKLERPVKSVVAQPAFPYTVSFPAKNGETFVVTFVHEDPAFPKSDEKPHGTAAFTPAKGYRVGMVNGKPI
jgi:hypothetical protein